MQTEEISSSLILNATSSRRTMLCMCNVFTIWSNSFWKSLLIFMLLRFQEVCIKKAKFSGCKGLKSEFKGHVVSKFDLGLLNAYNPIILIEISVKIRMAKISKGCLSEN